VQGYTRRQLKEDKFAQTAQGAAEWTATHQRTVIGSVVFVVVAALATVGIVTWYSHYTQQANIALSAAMRTFNKPLRPANAPATDTNAGFGSVAERGKAAEKEFQAVADKFPYSKPGKIARYLQGVAAMEAGDNASAEQQLKKAAGFGDKDVASLAQVALANLYRSTNRQSDAVRVLKELADHPTDTVSKAQAQIELAGIYETTDPQQATLLYQQIQKEAPNSAAAQMAASKLATNGGQK
jgi:tetratricopeptide (TPR) repeat protein